MLALDPKRAQFRNSAFSLAGIGMAMGPAPPTHASEDRAGKLMPF